ncbi:MAG: carboxypeptidase regulatory-like domain-containing protein [Parachlamydiaceae bacterium]
MSQVKKYFSAIGSLFIVLLFRFSLIYGDAPIKGKVIDASSISPLENVMIFLIHAHSGELVDEMRSNANGMYEFKDVPSGKYRLQAKLRGWVSASPNFIEITVENQPIRTNFSLGIPGVIQGSVTDHETHLPIPHASVDIMRGHTIVSSVLTDENGFYRIDEVPPRPLIIRTRIDDFQSAMQLAAPVSNEILTIDFSLKRPPGKVNGRIFSLLTGEPICNAIIDIFDNQYMINSVQTNEDGAYALSEIPSGNYRLRVNAQEHGEEFQDITLCSNQLMLADFYLKKEGCIEGYVIHHFTEEPIAGVSIGFWKDGVLKNSVKSDENGFFRFSGLGEGLILAQARSFYDKKELVNLLPSELSTLTVDLLCREPTPPQKVVVISLFKRFAHQVNRVNYIKWIRSSDLSVVSYRIYCNGKKIGEVSAEASYVYRHRWAKGRQNYQVVAINAFGQKSLPKDGEHVEE